MSLIKSLLWRSALKSFHPIAPDLVNVQPILEAIRWAPSAYGVSPYDIHVVSDPVLKERLRAVSYNQSQVTECSHLLVFCARSDAGPTVERFLSHCDVDKIASAYAQAVRASLSQMDRERCLAWASCQTHIALGLAVAAAAELRLGSCPMSGFVAQEVHEILQLEESQWPVAYLAVGSQLDDQEEEQEGNGKGQGEGEKKKRVKRRIPLESFVHYHKGDSSSVSGDNGGGK